MKNGVKRFVQGRISRRDFVEWAGSGGLSLAATASVLRAQQSSDPARRPNSPASRNRNQTNVNPYEAWLQQENIPVYRDFHVADLRALRLKPWKRLNAAGAYVDLKGGEGVNDGYVCEIAPGASTTAQRYLFEEVLYCLSGEGESVIWTPGRSKQTVRWQAGSILAPPLNAWRQHWNRGKTPVRFVSITNAPVVIDLFHNTDFVFNNDYVFRDRYDSEPDFFGAGENKLYYKQTSGEESEIEGGVFTWDSGLVPDARRIGLAAVRQRGAGNSRIELQCADNSMQAHLSEFAVGTYKKAHRHGPGSHVVMLNGRGYTLLWKDTIKYSESKTQVRIDWTEASMFVPPDGWFHQHFNAGAEPARYLAATWGGDGKWFMRALGGGGRTHRLGKTSIRKGGNLIEYGDEDPVIRAIFESELKKTGLQSRMPSGGKA